ncbi:MAG: PVC-type heme-binding CxxCH protein [Planctomycetota bacterium]|nr:PVC-type heme-binding CxxCH protein [Planctomycetota bacterium]
MTPLLPLAYLTVSPLLPTPQDGLAHGDAPAATEMSREAREAIARFTLPEGFGVSLFAAEPLMAHPVAFTIDALGRFYVAETYRHSKGVTDIRGHMDWLEDDLASRTVADRVAMYRKHLSPERYAEEFETESERVVRLVDSDGDGEADDSTVFAAGFDDPAAGIGAGLLTETLPDGGVKVWFTCIPDMWELVDADGDGVAEQRERHSTGYGLRVALLGHDLHGPVIGPYGRLYFSMGDRGFNVDTAEGERLVRLGMGAIFRCELDGSDLEVFCDGLRNPQEIVFDEAGNLFTLDNNSDGGDKARWTMLLEGSDTGWRQAYQWVSRPHTRGPWNQEKIWHPFHPEQPAYVLPCIENFTSGPSGMTLYPGTGFGPEWNGRFFVCDFRGNPGYSGIHSFRNDPHLSGFALADTEKFVWDALPTDVEFGVDGDLYWSDWVTSYNKTGKGRIYRVSPRSRDAGEQAKVDEVRALLARGFRGMEPSRCVELLDHDDRRVREGAQRAFTRSLVRAGGSASTVEEVLSMVANQSRSLRSRTHLIRGVAAASRKDVRWSVAGMRFVSLLGGASPELAVQLISGAREALGGAQRWAASKDEGGADREAQRVVEALKANQPAVLAALCEQTSSPEPHVRRVAVEALGAIPQLAALEGGVDPIAAIMAVLDAEASKDPWMRHTCIRALERLDAHERLIAAAESGPEHVRRAAVVILRRAGDARVSMFLDDRSPLVRAEAARAIHDVPIAGAMAELAARLPYLRPDDEVLTWRRVIQANRELGSSEAAQRLADFAVRIDAADALRVEAVEVLTDWTRPRSRDGILMDHRPIGGGDGASIAALAAHPVMDLPIIETALRPVPLEGRELSDAEINAQELFGTKEVRPPSALPVAVAMIDFHRAVADSASPANGRAALGLLASAEELEDDDRVRAFEALMDRYGDDRRAQGFALAARTLPGLLPLRSAAFARTPDSEAAVALDAVARGEDPAERREAIRVLGGLHGEACAEIFAAIGSDLEPTAPELVEWMAAAERHPSERVKAALSEREASMSETGDAIAAWLMCLQGGDVERGRAIFTGKSETACLRCHVVGDEGGSEAGPALDGVGQRLTREEILRSIVEPNAQIAAGYESWLLSLDDGEILSGRILEETEALVVVETSKKEVWEIPPGEITARRRDVSAMPADVSSHLSRAEMRDLVAFLASLGD